MTITFDGNLDETPDSSTVPADWYDVRVETIDVKETGPNSKVPGTPLLFIVARIMKGEFEGRTLVWNLVLGGDSLPFVKRCFAAAGVGWASEGVNTSVDEQELAGKMLQAKATIREYNGEMQNSVSAWKGIDA